MANFSSESHYLKGIKIAHEGRNAKVHGEISGFPVGSSWENRIGCSRAGVHAPLRGGIHGNATDGAFSVVLSGGYEDDEDNGEMITYTGQGGRDTKGTQMDQLQGKTLWEGAQNADQEWVRGNKALKISCTTKKPVRVIRGHTLDSQYAPAEGYRYDGLYVVDAAWRAVGKTEFKTCRFTFRRLPNQLPIPGTRSSIAKITHKSKPASESRLGGPITPKAGPSTLPPFASMSLGPASTPIVSNTEIVTARRALNKSSVPSTSNPLRKPERTNLSLIDSTTVIPSNGSLKRANNNCRTPSASTNNSRPSFHGEDRPMARASVVPLQMVQVQRTSSQSVKRPREECVSSDDYSVAMKRKINPQPSTQAQGRWATVEGAKKYTHLKFKKHKKTEN